MSDQDRYIPGVPCWVDTTQPDPGRGRRLLRRAVRLGARGRRCRRTRPASTSSPGSRRGRAARSAPRRRTRRRRRRGTRTSGSTTPTRRPRRSATPAAPCSASRSTSWTRGAWGSSPTRRAPPSASGSRRQHRGATVVNEHGSVNFNVLNTRDLDGADKFYGAVFGWEVLDAAGSMWALPAYGDFLEQRTPGHAREHGQDGRAAALRGGGRERQPDPRRPARHAGALGRDVRRRRRGRDRRAGDRARRQVVVAPFDAPWVRMTVITDPQGATFTASKFVPENKDLAQSAGAATGT